MPNKDDYHWWLYEQKYETTDSFLNYVSGLVGKSNVRINLLLVSTLANLKLELEEWSPERFVVETKNDEPVFTIQITKKFDSDKEIVVKAVVVKHPVYPAVYMVLSDCNSDDFKNIVTKLMNKHYPVVSQIYLTNNEMRLIFDKLQRETGFDIIVEFSVGKKRLPGERKKESQVTYTNQPYLEVFDEIVAHDQWIQSIRYRAEKIKTVNDIESRTTEFMGVITRTCFFSCKNDFGPLTKIIIPNAIKLASVRNEYLKIRAESAAELNPKPAVIKFDDEIFTDISKNHQYVDALVELDSCSVSEYHTNPYIHVSMLDYLDGSSYDIWVLTSDKLVIIPQFKATTASMTRLVNHIFERIHEGEVTEYEQIEVNARI